ncbi:predicted protein [Histoplasma mississippiense (nom. inval.)]|uniref:predicted protein n=1 Tax=Ajellomyces capsulatus (strain NAm1 / WU24) TaxID=2059318 RepID=UPI000157B8A9|nr:predicted protein [Histoplasma mississippiense (nom. inval.)]EDN03525.1 predicted protein [Histoplasma mississippiense (nom. inval.)]
MAKVCFPRHLRQTSIFHAQSRSPHAAQVTPLHPPTVHLCDFRHADKDVPRRYLAHIRRDDSELDVLRLTPVYFSANRPQRWKHKYGDEKLVVRWRTEGGKTDSPGYFGKSSPKESPPFTNGEATTNNSSTTNRDIRTSSETQSALSSSSNGTNRGLSKLGLFIFLFDDEGRIASHTIEHADESNGWDRTARVVTLTDWLLGKAKWPGSRGDAGATPALAVGLDLSRDDKMLFKNKS